MLSEVVGRETGPFGDARNMRGPISSLLLKANTSLPSRLAVVFDVIRIVA